jgi:hypothetical protein
VTDHFDAGQFIRDLDAGLHHNSLAGTIDNLTLDQLTEIAMLVIERRMHPPRRDQEPRILASPERPISKLTSVIASVEADQH